MLLPVSELNMWCLPLSVGCISVFLLFFCSMDVELWHHFAAGHQAAVCGWLPYRRQAQWHGKFGCHSQDIHRQLWKGWERFAGGRSGLLSACVELNCVWCISIHVAFESLVTVLLKSMVLWNMLLGQLTFCFWHLEGTCCVHIQGHVVKFLLHDHSPCNTVSWNSWVFIAVLPLHTVSLFVNINTS